MGKDTWESGRRTGGQGASRVAAGWVEGEGFGDASDLWRWRRGLKRTTAQDPPKGTAALRRPRWPIYFMYTRNPQLASDLVPLL